MSFRTVRKKLANGTSQKMKSMLLAILATTLTALLPAGAAPAAVSATATAVASVKASAWPMFRGSPALTGVASGTLSNSLVKLWSFKTQGPVKSSAAIENGRVFIGSDDGDVYCLEFATGKKVWAYKAG